MEKIEIFHLFKCQNIPQKIQHSQKQKQKHTNKQKKNTHKFTPMLLSVPSRLYAILTNLPPQSRADPMH